MISFNSLRVTNIVRLQTVVQSTTHESTMQNRTYYGLSFCQEGRITYTMDGKEYVSAPGYAILHPKGASYTLRIDRPGQFPLINFDCIGLDATEFAVIPLHNADSFLRQYSQMQQQALFYGDDLKLLSMFYDLLSQLSREMSVKEAPLHEVLSYMEAHLSDPTLSNTQLARQAGFSEVYFRRLFTKAYNLSPRQYLLNMRLKKAKQLLTDSNYSVTAISELCGFSNVYHFSRCFTDRVGLPPSDYARKNKPSKI